MAVNPDLVERDFEPTKPYTVSAAKIAEFAEAVGSTDAAHFDAEVARARGYRDVIAPPTFAVVISQRAELALMGDPTSGIDFGRVVHGEQSFTHHRPMTAGDAVAGKFYVDAVRQAGNNTMVLTRCELTAGDEPVCTTRSTVVVRGGN